MTTAACPAPSKLDLAATRILWAPFPGMQERFVAASEFEVLGGGAKGPGKSDCLIAAASRQVDREAYKALITRETGPQLRELVARTHRLYSKLPTAQRPVWRGDGHGHWTWPSGARLYFEAIGKPEDVDRIQGQEWGFVGQDEVGNVPEERTVDLVQAEIRSPDPAIVRMWRGTANPGKAGHPWVVRRFIKPCGRDGRRIVVTRFRLPNGMEALKAKRFIPGTVLDNPIYANDPLYMAQLYSLPETLRRQLLYGDWDAGLGLALDELDEGVHYIHPFPVPAHWTRFGSLDWGYAHYWVFIEWAVDEDGVCYVLDVVRGRRQKVHEIAERIHSRVEVGRLAYIHTDSAPSSSRGTHSRLTDGTPTIAEELADHGIIVSQGNTDRKATLNHARHYLAWRGIAADHTGRRVDGEPMVRFFATPAVRWLFEQLQSIVVDEDDPEDALKVDCDPDTGAGGDDGYDAFRYGLASRPPRAIGLFMDQPVRAFSPEALRFMVETLYKDAPLPTARGIAHPLAASPANPGGVLDPDAARTLYTGV